MNWMLVLYVVGIIVAVLIYIAVAIFAEQCFLDYMKDLYPEIDYTKNKNLLSNKWAPARAPLNQDEL